MQALTWILGGIAAGWLTGFTRKGRGYGLLGNLLIGMAGGLVGVWLFRSLGVTAPGGPSPTCWCRSSAASCSPRASGSSTRPPGAPARSSASRRHPVVDDVQAQVRRLGGLELTCSRSSSDAGPSRRT